MAVKKTGISEQRIEAGPTKKFFVDMLTRDIELSDAILDNCVDGALRKNSKANGKVAKDKPYKGYWAKITATPQKFSIVDNCGGIEESIAVKSAFMFGRPDPSRDEDLPTVGMYGIGMKRAIFKMGTRATVRSQPPAGAYKVEITPEWMQDDTTWFLSLLPSAEGLKEDGTEITVSNLRDQIKRQFDEKSHDFVETLKKQIQEHYALIIEKGFQVAINGNTIAPAPLTLLSPEIIGGDKNEAIEPYVYLGDFDTVKVEIVIGFRSALVAQPEVESETTSRRKRDDAGITVVCNDRVVLYNDKSAQTGWGTGSVPAYHNQFISIAGIVTFLSADAERLPINTTKRHLDTSDDLYFIVLDHIRTGLRKFTTFTNNWKRREEEAAASFQQLKQRRPSDIVSRVAANRFTMQAKTATRGKGRLYTPKLPVPPTTRTTLRICFSASTRHFRKVSQYLFGRDDAKPADVGERCFKEVFEAANE